MSTKKLLSLLVITLFVVAVGVTAGSLIHFEKCSTSGTHVAAAEVNGVSLRIELATSTQDRVRGLSGRSSIPENYGMLFVFPNEAREGFWMKDMLVSLDIFWLDAKGQVVSLAQNVPPASYPNVLEPTEPALYVLEARSGFAKRHDIATGTVFKLKNIPSVLK